MPSIEESDLDEKAVLWTLSGVDTSGQPIVSEPIEIDVHWRNRRGQFRTGASRAGVEAEFKTDIEIPLGSAVWLGDLSDWTGARPSNDQGVMEVTSFDRTVDLKGRDVLHNYKAARLRNSWPNIGPDAGSQSGSPVDKELSNVSYNRVTAPADGSTEIRCTVELLDSEGIPVTGRLVTLTLSSSMNISYDNSPQDTDEFGTAILRMRGSDPVTLTAYPSTNEDGALASPKDLEFTVVVV